MNNKTPILPFTPEVFSGTEDKRLNIMTKDAPSALIAQEISRVLGAWSQEL